VVMAVYDSAQTVVKTAERDSSTLDTKVVYSKDLHVRAQCC